MDTYIIFKDLWINLGTLYNLTYLIHMEYLQKILMVVKVLRSMTLNDNIIWYFFTVKLLISITK